MSVSLFSMSHGLSLAKPERALQQLLDWDTHPLLRVSVRDANSGIQHHLENGIDPA